MVGSSKYRVVLALGSNVENRLYYLEEAITRIESELKVKVKRSAIYESAPVGYYSDNLYFNCCVSFSSEYSAESIHHILQKIETSLGRTRKEGIISDRTIDIDIIFYGQEIILTDDLTIPHPRMHLRGFVLVPLLDIESTFEHPILKKPVWQLYSECPDDSEIILYES
jgi:2-amino-4-hydroxy-6-hydroxymethyldihydropteridine diphosphokinase